MWSLGRFIPAEAWPEKRSKRRRACCGAEEETLIDKFTLVAVTHVAGLDSGCMVSACYE